MCQQSVYLLTYLLYEEKYWEFRKVVKREKTFYFVSWITNGVQIRHLCYFVINIYYLKSDIIYTRAYIQQFSCDFISKYFSVVAKITTK